MTRPSSRHGRGRGSQRDGQHARSRGGSKAPCPKRCQSRRPLAVAKVDAAGQFADDDEVGTAADLGLEGRGVHEGVGGEEAGAQVSVRAHLLAQPQQALLRADSAGAPFGTANGTEEDGVGGLGGGEGLVCEGGSVGIDGALGER